LVDIKGVARGELHAEGGLHGLNPRIKRRIVVMDRCMPRVDLLQYIKLPSLLN
jgi:hypothetical protein